MFVQRPGRGCGQSHRAQVQGDVLSDHVRERSARQRADGLGCQGDDALHRADLPEQPFRGGDLFDGFAQDEVHRHGEAPHELGDAYQCDHHGVAVLDCEGRQRHEQRRQSGREQRGDEQGAGRHAPDEGARRNGAHNTADAAARGGEAHRHVIHMQHADHKHVVDRKERGGEEVELARGERDGTDDPVPPDEAQATQHITVVIVFIIGLDARRFILPGRMLRCRGRLPFPAFEYVEQHQQRAAHVRHEIEQQGQSDPRACRTAIRRRSARCLRRLRWRPRSARWRAADGPWAQAIPYSRCGRCRIPARKPRAAGGQSRHVATAEHGIKLSFYKESQRFRAIRLAGPKSAHTRQGCIPRMRNAPPSGATLFCWTTPTRRVKSISKLFCIEDLARRGFI